MCVHVRVIGGFHAHCFFTCLNMGAFFMEHLVGVVT